MKADEPLFLRRNKRRSHRAIRSSRAIAEALEKVITAINQADLSEKDKNAAKSLLRKLLGSKAAASVLGPGAQSLADKYFRGIEQRAGVKDSLASFRVLDSHDKKRSVFRKMREDSPRFRGND